MPRCFAGKTVQILVFRLCICQVFPISDHRVSLYYYSQKAAERSGPAMAPQNIQKYTHQEDCFSFKIHQLQRNSTHRPGKISLIHLQKPAGREEGKWHDTVLSLQLISRPRNRGSTVLFMFSVSPDHQDSKFPGTQSLYSTSRDQVSAVTKLSLLWFSLLPQPNPKSGRQELK